MTDLKTDEPTIDDEVDEPAELPELGESPLPPKRPRRRPSAVVSALAAALIAAIAAAGLFAYQLEQRRSLDTSRTEAVDTARTFAITLFTYSAESFDTYIENVLSGATGSLADTFTETSSDLRATLMQAGATSTAQVLDIAARSLSLIHI